jgi:hypothetical protein
MMRWTQAVPFLLRALFSICAVGVVFFLGLSGLALWAGSPPKVLFTFVLFAMLEAYGCVRTRRWQRSLAVARASR